MTGFAERHRLDDGARQRIGVDAGYDGDVEVGDERAHVGAEAQQAKAPADARARSASARHSATWSGRKSSGVSPDDDEGDAVALGRRVIRVERDARRVHHLDVALAPQDAAVAPEDDRVAPADRARRAGVGRTRRRVELVDVERVVDDAYLLRAVREERGRRARHADDAAHAVGSRSGAGGAPPPRCGSDV